MILYTKYERSLYHNIRFWILDNTDRGNLKRIYLQKRPTRNLSINMTNTQLSPSKSNMPFRARSTCYPNNKVQSNIDGLNAQESAPWVPSAKANLHTVLEILKSKEFLRCGQIPGSKILSGVYNFHFHFDENVVDRHLLVWHFVRGRNGQKGNPLNLTSPLLIVWIIFLKIKERRINQFADVIIYFQLTCNGDGDLTNSWQLKAFGTL